MKGLVLKHVCKLTTDLQLEYDEMDLDHFLTLPLSVVSSAN